MEKKTTRNLGIAILMVCLFAIGFVSGRLFQANNASISNVFSGRSDVNFQLYWNVWDLMQSKYVDSSKVDDQNMLYGSIKGMVNSFGDAATVFLDPEETKTFNEASEGKLFQGIGAELGYDSNNQIIVVSPLEGSPAKAAGIKAGDYILTIDGVAITSTDTVYDAVAKIRGEAGTKVTLGILHKGATKAVDIEITRSEITVPSMSLSYVGDNKDIALFQVSRFTDSSYSEWTKNWDTNVESIVDSGVKKVILDLRGNPGGYFDAAIYAADDFVGSGKILAQEQDSAGKIQKFNSTKGGKLENMEVVVLVDGGSASASEILSGALQQSGRATIIGDKTYGKGTAQSVLDLSDGSTLHVTILKWLLPDGGWLNHDNPITPNIEIANSEKDFTKGIDTQLNKAISEIEN
ncbi:S41 family peptidase [Patescibacteria group bacterium]|nr:S41 family peptidase [Patescibacteria group bacterium]